MEKVITGVLIGVIVMVAVLVFLVQFLAGILAPPEVKIAQLEWSGRTQIAETMANRDITVAETMANRDMAVAETWANRDMAVVETMADAQKETSFAYSVYTIVSNVIASCWLIVVGAGILLGSLILKKSAA